MTAYKDKDFTVEFNLKIKKAKGLWREICIENFKNDGDNGSCVIGAGIEIQYIPKGCRKPRRKMIISSREVMQCQGSLNWEMGKDAVLIFLMNEGIKANFNWGSMD